MAVSVSFSQPCCLRPTVAGSTFGLTHFRGHFYVYFRYGPLTRAFPKETLVDRLQGLGFPPPCYPSYEALTITPTGLTPAEHTSLRWTHNHACDFPAHGSPVENFLIGIDKPYYDPLSWLKAQGRQNTHLASVDSGVLNVQNPIVRFFVCFLGIINLLDQGIEFFVSGVHCYAFLEFLVLMVSKPSAQIKNHRITHMGDDEFLRNRYSPQREN